MSDSSIESFRKAFASITAITNAAAILWLSILSRSLSSWTLPGAIIGASMFYFSEKAGLTQVATSIGSHDLPLFFFSCLTLSLFLIAVKEQARDNSQIAIHMLVTCLLFSFLGLSVRPYFIGLTLSLGMVTLLMMIYTPKSRNTEHNTALKVITSTLVTIKSASALLWIIWCVTFISSAYWFTILIVKYNSPVVYSHSTQFAQIESEISLWVNQIQTTWKVIKPNEIGFIFLSNLNQTAGYVSSIALIAMLFIKSERRIIISLLAIAATSLTIPLIIKQADNWKSFYSLQILLFWVVPIVFFSLFLKNVRLKNNKISLSILIGSCWLFAYQIHNNNILPSKKHDHIFNQDHDFRTEVKHLVKNKGKILVLRGGEPGGDSQSYVDDYYYWDNVFLFGDIDQHFFQNQTSAQELLDILRGKNVTLIFDPTGLPIKNHSGLAYANINRVIKENENYFKRVLERKDGYKGIIYEVKYK